MWFNRVIPMWQDPAGLQVDPRLFIRRDFQASLILPLVQTRATAEATLRFCRANEFQDRLATSERLARPVQTDGAKQTVFNRIPLRSPGRIVGHPDRQLELVRQGLEVALPQPTARIVCAAIIGFNQQALLARVGAASHGQPPGADRGHRELSRLVRETDHHIAFVARQVVDTVGDRFPLGISGKICRQHLQRLAPPGTSWGAEVTDQLLLFSIHANAWKTSLLEGPSRSSDVAHFAVPIGIMLFRPPLAVDAQHIVTLLQQTTDRRPSNFNLPAPQLPTEPADSFAGPFDAADGIPR